MNATTLSAPMPAHRLISPLRIALAVIFAAALLVAVFVAGRISAPSHTAQSVVTVPAASAQAPFRCHAGRPC